MSRRDAKAIAAVPCPVCPAEVGEPCRASNDAEVATFAGRIWVHGKRRQAWQDHRRARGADVYAQPDGGSPGGRGGWLSATSPAAYEAAIDLPGATVDRTHVRVRNLRAAIDALTADGWVVE
jgi:hypothetical protein